jgi:hypothetical protein
MSSGELESFLVILYHPKSSQNLLNISRISWSLLESPISRTLLENFRVSGDSCMLLEFSRAY